MSKKMKHFLLWLLFVAIVFGIFACVKHADPRDDGSGGLVLAFSATALMAFGKSFLEEAWNITRDGSDTIFPNFFVLIGVVLFWNFALVHLGFFN